MGDVSPFKCRNPTLKECEDVTHTPEMGTWESSGSPENSELDCRGQNTFPWGVIYIVGKVLKLTCRKWPRMSHSNICSTSYVRKKGQESDWQFDSRPLKVGNRLDAGVCRQSATHHWKALKESYKFASDLSPIGGLTKELWTAKIPGVQTETISGEKVPLGCKCNREYYMGEGGGFPRVRAVVSLMSPKSLVTRPSTKGAPESELTNLWLVGCRSK
jgi:hypothetical protein